uniref:Uncharacterized protein n=1 Tax=Romanomermis culicivorax TaxID=13658 RepID=A0A915HH33_ROMCU
MWDYYYQLAADGVRVNAINPGPVPTNILRDLKIGKAIGTGDIPMGRSGTTTETSDAILFLASERSSYTTGVTLAVDGGMSVSPVFKE